MSEGSGTHGARAGGVIGRLTSEVDGEHARRAAEPGFTMGFVCMCGTSSRCRSWSWWSSNGSGDVEATPVSADGTLQLDLDRSGDVDRSGPGGRSRRGASPGLADVAAGSAAEPSVDLEASGDVDAEQLEAEDAVVTLSGSGEVDVSASVSSCWTPRGSGQAPYSGIRVPMCACRVRVTSCGAERENGTRPHAGAVALCDPGALARALPSPGDVVLRELWLVRHGESIGNVAATQVRDRSGLDVIPVDDPRCRCAALRARRRAGPRAGGMARRAPRDDRPVLGLALPASPPDAGIALGDRRGHMHRIVVDQRLRDRELGILDLLTGRGVARLHPEEMARPPRHLGKFYHRPPGGDRGRMSPLRLRSFLGDALDAPGRHRA